jgi:hypothetical protein
MRALTGLTSVLAVLALACGGSTNIGSPGAGGSGGASGAGGATGGALGGCPPEDDGGQTMELDGGACTTTVKQHPDEGAQHLTSCLPAPTYCTNPPSSGNHYPSWADYMTYDTPVPWGHLVHSLEHGAIVIVYNCPGGCADEVAAAQAMIDALPVDPICTAPTKRRVILAPDPTLDVRWAASAWTWTIRAPCFDAAAFSAFAGAHYGMGREDLCGELHEPFCAVQ